MATTTPAGAGGGGGGVPAGGEDAGGGGGGEGEYPTVAKTREEKTDTVMCMTPDWKGKCLWDWMGWGDMVFSF